VWYLLSIDNDKLAITILKKSIKQFDEIDHLFNIVAIYRSGNANKYIKELKFIYENKGEQHYIQNYYMMLDHNHKRIN